ncbi:inositol monophosphatase family protein [Nitrosophilus kaiyonis]|uniref:inositol monophosphatase family protein n=1 Tax=Nitrosophilus kaiyonis TaxID=2930200 RepID=UPI0024936883|nr:inositol monophosphatase family protein [Nitrosophilus kaiyonis]
MVEKYLKNVLVASKKIFTLIQNGLDESYFDVIKVGAGGDKSTKIDLVSEEIYIKYLKSFGQIISEESGIIGEGEEKIILDPIDGSDNLISGFPYYGSSIAIKKDNLTIFSFIANFANGDFFVKSDDFYKKGNLYFEDFNLKDIEIKEYKGRIGLFEKAYANPKIVKALKDNYIKFRSPGAVALSLSYAHNVRFVLFAGKIREYDIAAGLHQCVDLNLYYNDKYILVSKSKELFDKIRKDVLKD